MDCLAIGSSILCLKQIPLKFAGKTFSSIESSVLDFDSSDLI